MRNAGAIACALFVFACSPDKRGAEHPDAAGPGQEAGNGGGDSGDGSMTYVYAHTSSTLYKVDPDTLAITMVGDFGWPNGASDQMTDLAIDKNGVMVGVSFGSVYKVDPTTAQATLLSSGLGGTFNGLSFVPASMLGMTGDDVLIGTRNDDGVVSRIDPMTGAVSMVGNMGSAFQSSGDLVAVDGFGTVQTTLGAPSDVLVRLAPNNFAATRIGTGTGFGAIWGLGFWKNKIFGFTQDGKFITIDPTTGVATLIQGGGPEWWGAAVTTSAPVLQ
jgi:hypothetical protein